MEDCVFMKEIKTNVMRILDKEKIEYTHHKYPHGKDAVDGVTVATLMNQNPDYVFKTLVTKGMGRDYYVFVVPVDHELDLKKCAKSVGEKSVEIEGAFPGGLILPVADLFRVIGIQGLQAAVYQMGRIRAVQLKAHTGFLNAPLGLFIDQLGKHGGLNAVLVVAAATAAGLDDLLIVSSVAVAIAIAIAGVIIGTAIVPAVVVTR